MRMWKQADGRNTCASYDAYDVALSTSFQLANLTDLSKAQELRSLCVRVVHELARGEDLVVQIQYTQSTQMCDYYLERGTWINVHELRYKKIAQIEVCLIYRVSDCQ